ncbi:MAG TPA: hypothetical protein VLB09_04640, partial [Nitrospiria bacterium]|nr:hypothetical protein [Nitrospiria bacterium]
MKKRIEAVRDRLHVGLVIARVVHSYAQEISLANQFIPVGFLPLRHLFSHRESFALLARYFGDAWTLRKNNPRVIPEACSLGHSVMDRAGRTSDLIVDEDSAPYPPSTTFRLEELSVEGFSSLMRIERGRVRNREVFGSMRLEYGFFRLKARHANYLVAKDESRIVGAIGFTLSPAEGTVKVFELIALTDRVIHFLFSALERKCSEKEGVEYIEIDVSAHAPRMQRTLLGLNFIPAAYIPAMVFHEVERLDIIKMVRLCRLQDLGPLELSPQVEGMVNRVMRGFRSRTVIPRIARAVSRIPLFQGLNTEQVTRLAGV